MCDQDSQPGKCDKNRGSYGDSMCLLNNLSKHILSICHSLQIQLVPIEM